MKSDIKTLYQRNMLDALSALTPTRSTAGTAAGANAMGTETYQEIPHRKEKTKIPKPLKHYRTYQMILDANDRSKSNYPLNNFVLKSTEFFYNVFAIRLLKSELVYISNVLGRGMYVYLNNYKLLYRSDTKDTLNMFARISPGVETYPCVTEHINNDPHTYILNPIEPKLQRFEVRLYDHKNNLIDDTQFNVVLHLALYCWC
jgi:hypothetical protein